MRLALFPKVTPVLIAAFLAVVFSFLFARTNNIRRIMSASRSVRLASSLARKVQSDEFWLHGNKRQWYALDGDNVAEASKGDARRTFDAFIELYEDEATKKFISNSVELSESIFVQMWHSVAKSFLSIFYSQTDINGYLGRGSMFVFSKEQFLFLLDKAGLVKLPLVDNYQLGNTLIDLGAGDGAPTEQLAPFFREVYATETSWSMRRILDKKGFKVLEVENWSKSASAPYDMISCMNLLDRCERPETLLKDIRRSLKPEAGLLLVALVLPFRPYVEFSSNNSHKPMEVLPITGETFESQVVSAVNYFETLNFELKSWAKVPYLCEGDLSQSLYVLHDAIFLLAPKSTDDVGAAENSEQHHVSIAID